MSRLAYNIVDFVLITCGAILIALALHYGLGITFHPWWWGFAFWGGIGVLLGWVKAK